MSWRKLLNTKPSIFLLLLIVITAPGLAPGCSKTKVPSAYLARVNDAYLTDQDMQDNFAPGQLPPQAKIEFAQTWIKNKLLYEEARKAGITDDETFRRMLERNKEELAATWYLNKLVEKQNLGATEQEAESYYGEHQQEFRLQDDAFFYSAAYFRNQDAAQDFRNNALREGWKNALNGARSNNTLAMSEEDAFAKVTGIYSAMQVRLLSLMAEEELSQIFSDDNAIFWVIKAGKSFKAGEIPPLYAVKGAVEARIVEKKKKDFIDGYIQGLYSSNKVEIYPQ